MILLLLAFIGGCSATAPFIGEIQEKSFIQPVMPGDERIVPMIAKLGGRYVVTGQRGNEAAEIVTAFPTDAETLINRDLNDPFDPTSDYKWFRIVKSSADFVSVVLEAPYTEDSKRVGWYTILDNKVVFEKVLYLGPGFAYVVMPWVLLSGLCSSFIMSIIIRNSPLRRATRA